MRKFIPLLFLTLGSLLLASRATATEPADLGQGLSYLRIRSVADSGVALRKTVPGPGALVLDLRYATASEASVDALKSALAARPASAPLFALVSPATPAVLEPVLTARGVLTLGVAGSIPTPRVVVRTDAAADRLAYDALDAGTGLTQLVTGKIEKERFDEATLVEEFKNGHEIERPVPPLPGNSPTPGTDATDTSAEKGKSPPPPTDRVLQRAIHLHRALLALRNR